MRIKPSQSIQLINITIGGLWSCIVLSYIVAVIGGHVPLPYTDGESYWPMISDTWVTLYGEFLSRIFIPPFVYTWAFFCWSICDWLDQMSWKPYTDDNLYGYIQFSKQNKTVTKINKYNNYINRYIVQFGLLNFLTCIAINEDDNDQIHSISAFLFFTTQLVFLVNVVVHLYVFKGHAYNKTSLLIKTILILLFTGCLITTAVLGRLNKWGVYEFYVAILEWGAVALVSAFHWTLKWEMSIIDTIDNTTFWIED